MNFGAVVLAVFLAAAALLGIFVIAGNTPSPYVDSYGNTTSESTNATIGLISNTTSPLSEAAGGAVLFLSAIALLITSLAIYMALQKSGGYSRRG